MSIDVSYPHIAKAADGSPCLKRLPRIRVAQIAMDYLAHGWSPDEMCRQHPQLQPAEIHSAMAYYFDHQADVEDEIRRELSDVDQARRLTPASPFELRLRAQGKL
jgi:uncharacterized protein (DUF433 family)